MMNPVTDNRAKMRFELEEDGGLSFADYARRDGVVAITHVETPPHLRGRGIAGRLMDGLLALVRKEGLKVQPICPYAAAHIARKAEWQDLLA